MIWECPPASPIPGPCPPPPSTEPPTARTTEFPAFQWGRLPPEQGLKRWFDKLALPVASLPEGVTVLADRTGAVYTLTIAPKGTGMVKELIVTFLENGTIRRLVINERNGDRATMTFKNVRCNTGLTNRDFRLE